MIRRTCYCLVLALVLGSFLPNVKGEAPLHARGRDKIPGHYIVVLKDNIDVDTFTSYCTDTIIHGQSDGNIDRRYRHAVKGFSARLSNGSLKKLRESNDVKYIEEDGIIHSTAVPSWGLDRVDQRDLPLDDQTLNYLGDGTGTHVYVIDTGTLYSHQEFTGRTGDGFDTIGDEIGLDCNGHGTHCGGTAGGTTYGIAKQATIHSVRVLGCSGSGTNSGVAAGMNWAAEHAQSNNFSAVASMSLGGGASQTIDDAVQNMIDMGMVVSVAAGNDDSDACDVSPARASGAITVGATDTSDTRASFSNYGSCVDIFAPGVGITSSVIGSNTATAAYSGTSMACPHVSGAVAVLLGVSPGLTPEQVTEQILRGSTENKVSDAKSANRLLYIGADTCMTRCDAAQDGARSCQCDSACSSRGDCCSDYGNLCGAEAPSCKTRCGTSDAGYPCSCDVNCDSRGDCCSDFSMECPVASCKNRCGNSDAGYPCPCDIDCVSRGDCCSDFTTECPGAGVCDVALTQEGVIYSPNYPLEYSNDLKCYTSITAGGNEVVQLAFNTLDIEYNPTCSWDKLTIYDGVDATKMPIGVYCNGVNYPVNIKSTQRRMFIAFESDESFTYEGYEAEIKFIPKSDVCDTVLDQEGVISSPNHPGQYSNDQTCLTTITAGAGEAVLVTFKHFDIEYEPECAYDRLTAYDGAGSFNQIGVFCGSYYYPDYIKSTETSMHLAFESDVSVTETGYEADVNFIPATDNCDVMVNQEGTISSPNYPIHYLNDHKCNIVITAGANEVILLTFIYLDIEYHPSCVWDSLTIYDGSDSSGAFLGVFCGSVSPASIQSTGNALYLYFETDSSVIGGGFEADVSFTSVLTREQEPTMKIPESLRKLNKKIPVEKFERKRTSKTPLLKSKQKQAIESLVKKISQ